MNDNRKYKIAVLSEDAHTKRLRFNALGLRNTPTNAQEALMARIEYDIARAEMIEAAVALEAEILGRPR